MAKALALKETLNAPLPLAEFVRAIAVIGCSLALAFAGPVLPF